MLKRILKEQSIKLVELFDDVNLTNNIQNRKVIYSREWIIRKLGEMLLKNHYWQLFQFSSF